MFSRKLTKCLFLGLLLVLCMSVAVAADVSEDTAEDVLATSNTDTATVDTQTELTSINNDNNNLETYTEEKSETPNQITINATTFDTYVTNGEFNDKVKDGDVIDIDGKLDGTKFSLTVNKAVNITSLKNNSYISLYTGSYIGDEYTGGIFQVIESGSNSNISNLYFEHTRIYIYGANNVFINNITVIMGMVNIRVNSVFVCNQTI